MLKSYLENLYFYKLYGELMHQSCGRSFSDNIHMEIMFKTKQAKILYVKVVRVMEIVLKVIIQKLIGNGNCVRKLSYEKLIGKNYM